jgi:hypothetical protein
MNNQFFKKFKQPSEILITQSLENLTNITPWENHYGLTLCVIPKNLWLKEPVLRKIHSQFEIESGFIIKISPNVLYNWHVDGRRAAGINLKLQSNSRSYTLFGDVQDVWNDNFTELEYESNAFYLFNTQHRHCVINFDECRYLFSVQFVKTKDEISYQEIYDWCLEEGLF